MGAVVEVAIMSTRTKITQLGDGTYEVTLRVPAQTRVEAESRAAELSFVAGADIDSPEASNAALRTWLALDRRQWELQDEVNTSTSRLLIGLMVVNALVVVGALLT